MTDINAAWRSLAVARFHSNPDAAHLGDSNAAHTGRVALLALCLWPTAHAVYRAAILHDCGEAATGDVSGEVKRCNPDLAAILDRIEGEARAAMDLPAVSLDERDAKKLHLADKLDAYLFIRHRAPHMLAGGGWPDDRAAIVALAWQTGVGAVVEGLLGPSRS